MQHWNQSDQRDVLEGSDIELLMLDIYYSKNKYFVFGVFIDLRQVTPDV